MAPEARVTVNGTDITLFVPDRTAVYWPRNGFASEPGTLAWIDGSANRLYVRIEPNRWIML